MFPWYLKLVSANHASSNPGQIEEIWDLGNLVPRVSRARRDPGRVWSRAFVTIENTREGSSLNKEFVAFVAFVALIHGVVKFLQTQPRLRRAILQWPS